ncbi:hypothetical protein CEE37_02355 [candidate division LCP-89 bacterium B3_LCP]|uniref:Uncharacterized protein n=1 Tax=candidate division LCP-89 bacterium B3_LCP TaxID=2012998 RepID=A0A532V5S8_UNCL8|nr:MAG: hypothetical protein CEE37_02355 [candidate division LCP-89 bacterium B3_LCP]
MSQNIYKVCLSLILSGYILTHTVCFAMDQQPCGTINGRIIDTNTKMPLAGANVVLANTQLGACSDLDGNFTLDFIPVGNYSMQCSYLGYEPIIIADVIVKSGRITVVEIELQASAIKMDVVTVKPNYFSKEKSQPTSVTNLSYEEIRRTAGAVGDVSRIIMALPSVAKVNDTRNSLVVRGGSPTENGYFVDNIAIPNINHFPLQGASSGATSLLNVDFIKDVRFYTGGFSAAYGDRLSSIMDISFREGNSQEFDGQLDLSLMGVGAIMEGPLGRGNTWLFSARRSYLDLIINSEDVEASTIPEYSDLQGKIVLDLSDKHQLTFLDVLGVDKSVIEKERSLDNEENVYGDGIWETNTAGLNWRYLWGGKGYSNTSLSHSFINWEDQWLETISDSLLTENRSTEQKISLRNTNHLNLNRINSIDFGVELQLIDNQYDDFYAAYTDPLGNPTPEMHVDDAITSTKAGAFLSYTWKPFLRLTTIYGVRADYFDYNENLQVSPRFQFSYQLRANTTLNGAYGQFYQFLPLTLMSQQAEFKELSDPMAHHYILGISHLLTENTRLTLEGYAKEYRNIPLDPAQPSLFIIDESNNQNGFASHEQLVDNGVAYTRGIELMVQKKLADKIYGLISGSYFRSRYRDFNGLWRDRIYDNRYMCTAEGGYKPNNKWEFSLRWVYAGGAPYTPFDITASENANRGIYDSDRINAERLPDYHNLNLRCDRRFNFKASNLILYLSMWNVYGRDNIASYYWNELSNKQDTFKQWGTLAAFGLEFEF